MTLTRARLLHPHTGDPITPLGHRRDGRPILPILGAGPDDEIDDEIDDEHGEDDDGEDDDEDEHDEDEEGGKPAVKEDGKPLTQKDYDALQLALRNARKAERRARRSERDGGRGRDGQGKPKDDKPKGEGEDAPDVERIRLEAEDSAAGTWKPLLVRREARDLLKDAGLIGDPGRLLKLIDMEDVEVDPETGEIDGLDEQIDDLRKEYKHLFRRRGTRRINGADKDGRETRGGRKLTATEIQAMQLLGDR